MEAQGWMALEPSLRLRGQVVLVPFVQHRRHEATREVQVTIQMLEAVSEEHLVQKRAASTGHRGQRGPYL
eukprot:5030570-Amphidinium_carterae.2